MNYELFIAKRIIFSKQGKSSISAPIIKIAITAIALGIIVMLISVATGVGLQHKIREKVAAFQGHIQITNYDNNNSEITVNPIALKQDFYPEFKEVSGIKNVHVFATKAGIIRTKKDFEGVIFKGVSTDYDWRYFNNYITQGSVLSLKERPSNNVLISTTIANRLGLKLGDKFNLLFVKNNPNKLPNLRVLKIVGLYNSAFNDFDKNYIIGDIRHLQKINKWGADKVGGFEILLYNFNDLKNISKAVYANTASTLNVQSIIDKYPSLFEWLSLFDLNITIIIVIMILIAGINMITALLVLILERTQMIGILKALGNANWSIRKIFLYNAAYLILKGLFWGNLIGITLLLLQQKFALISLNPETYYVKSVPVYIDVFQILLLNAGTLILCLFMLLIPSVIVTKISPVKAIKFN
ncbi:MAG: ABC transporter permease [Flavobacteriaceae bacterium]|nr:ABC transporter permease [Flavobacteriaceae bacterium]